MNKTAETLERALKNATNTISFWQQRAEAAEAEAADLRYLLDLVADLRHQLATVTALVPEADWLEMFMAVTRIEDDCTHCPYREDGKDGCEFPCNDVHDMARALAAAIRDWREEQGQEAEE